MNIWLQKRWKETEQLGQFTSKVTDELLELMYSDPARHYHTLQHLKECFDLYDSLDIKKNVNIELALWFHDLVYNTHFHDNEEKSANGFYTTQYFYFFGDQLATRIETGIVERMILATKSHIAEDPDTQLLLDLDLAILGSSPERFKEYCNQIRQEYSWVPQEIYNIEREKILRGFIERDEIYKTPQIKVLLEFQARMNLENAIYF